MKLYIISFEDLHNGEKYYLMFGVFDRNEDYGLLEVGKKKKKNSKQA